MVSEVKTKIDLSEPFTNKSLSIAAFLKRFSMNRLIDGCIRAVGNFALAAERRWTVKNVMTNDET